MFTKKKDILMVKKMKLTDCQGAFDAAVSIVNSTIATLKMLNDEISDNVAEIEDYQHELEVTKADLNESKRRNEQVIRNFQALLSVE